MGVPGSVDRRPLLVFTAGDPAGIGPELLLKLLSSSAEPASGAVVVAERRALEAHAPDAWPDLERFVELEEVSRAAIEALGPGEVALVQPLSEGSLSEDRGVVPGAPTPADARAALAALDRGAELVRSGVGDALVTAPINKEEISRAVQRGFVGHTDYLASAAGLGAYGDDYLMCFLTDDLQVALLTTHLPLHEAIEAVDEERVLAALLCLKRHAGGRIAVAGLNPHAGEGGLLGDEEVLHLAPAIDEARRQGVDVHGPYSADSLFARARRGEFDWVLALYHDQGLVAVKTAAFGRATNWTLGLPYLRTSVDHGTAYEIAGRWQADVEPLRSVVETTVQLWHGDLPRRRSRSPSEPRTRDEPPP